MAFNFFARSASTLAVSAMMISSLAGCGHMVTAPKIATAATVQFSAGSETEATSTLMQGFDDIHKAIFTKLDKDKDGFIDEYEAGNNLALSDFKHADTDGDDKVSYGEFKKYAITNLFFFHDSATDFTSRFRSALGDVFKRLDTNRDGLLQKNETSLRDLKKLGLTFQYPRLNINVKINKIDQGTFKAADKTGDGVLSQAEFEDLYINMVILALGGKPADGPPATDDNTGGDDNNVPAAPNAPGAPPAGTTPTTGTQSAPANPPAPPAPAAE